jgi:hypothetical protein
MDIIFTVVIYLLAVHLVARRGFKTGLFYERVFALALVPFLFPFVVIWVFWRDKRKGIGYYRIPPK